MSRARLNKNSRRHSALERRKKDVVTLTGKAKDTKDPDQLAVYKSKLETAVREVATLEGLVVG